MIKWKENTVNIIKKFVTLILLKIEKLTSMGIYLAQWSMTQFESDLKNWNFGVGKTDSMYSKQSIPFFLQTYLFINDCYSMKNYNN